jgi:hypothetical protein
VLFRLYLNPCFTGSLPEVKTISMADKTLNGRKTGYSGLGSLSALFLTTQNHQTTWHMEVSFEIKCGFADEWVTKDLDRDNYRISNGGMQTVAGIKSFIAKCAFLLFRRSRKIKL